MSMSGDYFDRMERREERINAENRIEALEQMLCECLDYFNDFSDVVDGADGQPSPNREMRMVAEIKEILGPLSATERRSPRDGLIYAAVSRADTPSEELVEIKKDIDAALARKETAL